jgi:arylsulfatase A-like enzyme
LLGKLNAELAKRFGEGPWARGMLADTVVLNRALAAERKVDAALLAEEARKVVLTEPGIAVVYTRAELESGSRKGAPLFDAMRRTWHRDVSGDLQLALKPNWAYGTHPTHGSPHAADTHIPILFYGPPWVMQGRSDASADLMDIAPTLARILRVPAPAASEGKVLPIGAAVR